MTKSKKLNNHSHETLLTEMKKLNEKIDMLDSRLNKHIAFIENVYAPLSNSIEKFKKLFK